MPNHGHIQRSEKPVLGEMENWWQQKFREIQLLLSSIPKWAFLVRVEMAEDFGEYDATVDLLTASSKVCGLCQNIRGRKSIHNPQYYVDLVGLLASLIGCQGGGLKAQRKVRSFVASTSASRLNSLWHHPQEITDAMLRLIVRLPSTK